jgi:hypothetical protein
VRFRSLLAAILLISNYCSNGERHVSCFDNGQSRDQFAMSTRGTPVMSSVDPRYAVAAGPYGSGG